MYDKGKKFSDIRLHQIWDNLNWSLPKHKAILDLAENPEAFYFDLLQYHTRWKDITLSDFSEHTDKYKGADFYLQTTPFESVVLLNKTEKEIPPQVTLEYLQKIITLCEEENIDLVLTGMPTYQDSYYRQKLYNYIEEFAEKNNVEFINFYFLMNELGISWEKDFSDKMHLNYSAAQKVTNYLGMYLGKNYDLIDHRGEDLYASWNDAWRNYWQNNSIVPVG